MFPIHLRRPSIAPRPIARPAGRNLLGLAASSLPLENLVESRASLDPPETDLILRGVRRTPEGDVLNRGALYAPDPGGGFSYLFDTGDRIDRTTRIQPFGWQENGLPDFGEPLPLSTDILAPSGE